MSLRPLLLLTVLASAACSLTHKGSNDTGVADRGVPDDITDVSDIIEPPDTMDEMEPDVMDDSPDAEDVGIDTPDVLDAGDVPDASDVQDASDVRDVLDVQDVTDAQDVVDVTDAPDAGPTYIDLDFRNTALGEQQPPMGVRFRRSSQATVQTDTNVVTLVPNPDRMRIGRPSTDASRGLVIEEARSNLVADPQDLTTTNWGTVMNCGTINLEPSPIAPFFADELSLATANTSCPSTTVDDGGLRLGEVAISYWAKRRSGTSEIAPLWGSVPLTSTGATNDWRRFSFLQNNAAQSSVVFAITPPSANSFAIDMVQVERGRFPTEALISPAKSRSGEVLYLDESATVAPNGRLRLELEFIPKGARSEYASAQSTAIQTQIFYVDATHFAQFEISPTTYNLVVVSGTTLADRVEASIPDWSRGDTIKLKLEAGAGMTTGSMQVGTATPTLLNFPSTVLGGLPSAKTISFMSRLNGAAEPTNQFSCWLRRLIAYTPSGTFSF